MKHIKYFALAALFIFQQIIAMENQQDNSQNWMEKGLPCEDLRYCVTQKQALLWIKRLIEIKGNINYKDPFVENTPLSASAASGWKKAVRLLLNQSCVDVDCYNKEGLTPLMLAALNDYPKIARLLLRYGAHPNLKLLEPSSQIHQSNALIFASMKGHYKVVQILLNQSEISINDIYLQLTPLMWAAYMGKLEVVSLLLLANADISIQDRKGKTAKDLARDKIDDRFTLQPEAYRAIVKLIEEHESKIAFQS